MALYSVKNITGKGRGLVAEVDIKAGTLILSEEPHAACLEEWALEEFSSFSFEASPSLVHCKGCKVTW